MRLRVGGGHIPIMSALVAKRARGAVRDLASDPSATPSLRRCTSAFADPGTRGTYAAFALGFRRGRTVRRAVGVMIGEDTEPGSGCLVLRFVAASGEEFEVKAFADDAFEVQSVEFDDETFLRRAGGWIGVEARFGRQQTCELVFAPPPAEPHSPFAFRGRSYAFRDGKYVAE